MATKKAETIEEKELSASEKKRLANIEKSKPKRQAKAKEYEQAEKLALNEQKKFLTQINNLFKETGTRIRDLFNTEQRELYDGLKKDYWGSRASSTAASNRAFSYYMAATSAAHDNAMLASQGF